MQLNITPDEEPPVGFSTMPTIRSGEGSNETMTIASALHAGQARAVAEHEIAYLRELGN
jgi:hypothetical protein